MDYLEEAKKWAQVKGDAWYQHQATLHALISIAESLKAIARYFPAEVTLETGPRSDPDSWMEREATGRYEEG